LESVAKDEQEIDIDHFNQKFLKQLYKNILMSFVIDSRVSRRRLSDNERKVAELLSADESATLINQHLVGS
jgi:hypothetical protein